MTGRSCERSGAGQPGDGGLRADGPWEALCGHGQWPTLSRAFTLAAARHLSPDDSLLLLTAGPPDRPDGLAPLCRRQGLSARWRLPAMLELGEPADVLLRDPGAADGLAARMARLRRPIELDRLPAGSPLVAALRKAMKGRGLLAVRPTNASPTIALDAGWRQPETRFNAGRRSDFRRAARRAEAHGPLRYETLSPTPETFRPLYDEAVEVEQRGWKGEAGTALAANPAHHAFFAAFLRDLCRSGNVRISFLRIDGRAIAMQLGVVWAGRYWLFKIGHDRAYDACSPGTLLMLNTIGWAAGEGLRSYELLGGVEPWITKLWTSQAHDCVRLRTYPFNPLGGLALASDVAAWLRGRLASRAP